MKKCSGHNSAGKPCGNWPIKGADVCRKHGGAAPQVQQAAKVRVLEEQARKLIPVSSGQMADPIGRLLELAAEADAFREAVASLVNSLKSIETYSLEAGSQLRAEVMLYERAIDRVARLCIEIVKLNLEERLVRVREGEARMMADALDAALTIAGLSVEQAQTVKRETAARLRVA